MMDTIGRARLIGAAVLAAAFGAGVAVGHYVIPRRVPEGVVVSIKSAGRIPRELEELDLQPAQRERIRDILNAGTRRVGRVLETLMVPMDAAIDSTDAEVRQVLTPAQNRQLDEIRKVRPLKRLREKRMIDSSR